VVEIRDSQHSHIRNSSLGIIYTCYPTSFNKGVEGIHPKIHLEIPWEVPSAACHLSKRVRVAKNGERTKRKKTKEGRTHRGRAHAHWRVPTSGHWRHYHWHRASIWGRGAKSHWDRPRWGWEFSGWIICSQKSLSHATMALIFAVFLQSILHINLPKVGW
jgi:hypothetical protein